MIDTVRWQPCSPAAPLPGKVRMIDQTRLPEELVYLETDDLATIYDAIQRLVVRGAPAIGCAAGLGLAAVAQHSTAATAADFRADVRRAADHLATARPTAVNLAWALDRCTGFLAAQAAEGVDRLKLALQQEAQRIVDEDIAMCRRIGEHGLALFKHGARVLTHCNAGALATADYGTALAPVYAAHERGKEVHVYADETRPLLQGARLTAWELRQAGVDVTVICDNMSAQLMAAGEIDWVLVGSDRIAANGDIANKIGTYAVAVLAHHHDIPFYVAAPYSTVDLSLADGSAIPIEQRAGDEVACGFGRRTAPADVKVHNPAFDVTPHELVHGIITDKGLLTPPFGPALQTVATPAAAAKK